MEESELRGLVSHDVVDANGKSIGYVEYVFNDDETGRPEWIGVLTGTLRHQHILVPVAGVERVGTALRVPYTKDRVKAAPTYDDASRGPLGLGRYTIAISKEKEQAAYAHFGLGDRGMG